MWCFDQQLKITFRKSSGPHEKILPPFYSLPQKFKKRCKSPLFANNEIFPAPLQKGGRTEWRSNIDQAQ